MNVELVNPMSVFRLFERSDAARLQPSHWRTPAWAKQLWARLGEELRQPASAARLAPARRAGSRRSRYCAPTSRRWLAGTPRASCLCREPDPESDVGQPPIGP
jgi:hypothetical protein